MKSLSTGWRVLLAAVVAVVFQGALSNAFIQWDDYVNFVENPFYRGLGWSQISWAWTSHHLGVYQPLSWMLLSLEYVLFGLSPAGYHAISILLHAGCVICVAAVSIQALQRVLPDVWKRSPDRIRLASVLAALIFAVHPLRAEVVAWASCQPYLPCVLALLMGVLTYFRAHEPKADRQRYLFHTFLFFCAAVLFKAPAVTFPVLLLLMDVYLFKRRDYARALTEKVPYFVLVGIFVWVSIWARSFGFLLREDEYNDGIPLAERASRGAHALTGFGLYLRKTFLPMGLSGYYPFPRASELSAVELGISGVALVALIFAVMVLWRKGWRGPAFVLSAFIVCLLPHIGLVRLQVHADRYMYLASIPLALGLAGVLAMLPHPRWKQARVVVGAVAVVLATLSFAQVRIWRDDVTLWAHNLEVSKPSAFIYSNLAVHMKSQPDKATQLLKHAIALAPEHAPAHLNLGTLYINTGIGSDADAIRHLMKARELNPKDPYTLTNLGTAYLKGGDVEKAKALYLEAVALEKTSLAYWSLQANMNLGLMSAQGTDLPLASQYLQRVVQISEGVPAYSEYRTRALDILRQLQASM